MAESVTLRPLHCTGCGAVVPLGQGRTARCCYCRTETPIPEEYLAVQRVALGYASNRELARQLYGRIGKPPGKLIWLWGLGAERSTSILGGVAAVLVASPYVGIPLGASAAYALGYPVSWLIRGAYWIAGVPVASKLNTYEVLSVTSVLIVLLIGVPTILFGRERALAGVRRDIHASLAAAPPERPGGPSRCRACGAALDVPQGALGVPCPYCSTDNLVALPHKWVSAIRSSEFHQFLRLDAALEAYRRASIEAQEKLWKLALGFVFVFPVVLVFGWILNRLGFNF